MRSGRWKSLTFEEESFASDVGDGVKIAITSIREGLGGAGKEKRGERRGGAGSRSFYLTFTTSYKAGTLNMLNNKSQLYNTNTVYLNLYEVFSLDNFIKKERRMVVDRGLRRGREMWSYCLVDREFQFHSMKRILEMDDGAQQCEFIWYM